MFTIGKSSAKGRSADDGRVGCVGRGLAFVAKT
jgi:hypothetical protein